MGPARFRRLANLWPPFYFSGIRIERIAGDFRTVEVSLRPRLFNRHVQRSHFGGSLFAMTDPFYVLMLRHALGRGYVLWDKRASIDFVSPGRGTVTARFELTQRVLDAVIAAAAGGGKVLEDFSVTIVDAKGRTVATVEKTIYIRKAPPAVHASRALTSPAARASQPIVDPVRGER